MEVKKLRFISSMEIKSVLILFSLVVFYGMTIKNHTISAFSKKKNVVKVINSSKESLFINPNFTSSSPTNGANDVNQDANIVLNFDIAIDASTVNATNIIVSGSHTGLVSGTFSGGGTNQITFNPTADFKPGELVSVIITKVLLEDGGSDVLSNDIHFSFIVKVSSTTNNLLSTQTELLISNSQDKPKGIVSVDMDKDGDMDVLVSSADDGKVVWYENDGNQNFSIHQVEIGLMRARFSIAVDLDSDGDLDIVSIGETADRLQWYENDGNQNFSSAIIIAVDTRPFSLSAADIDGDGDIDLIVPNINDDQLIWYENDGNQNFSKNVIIDDDPNTIEQAVFETDLVDIDHDGDVDILVAEFNQDTYFLLENDGNQNFTSNVIGSSNGPGTVSSVDIDNDGDIDVVAGSWNSNEVIWFENTGTFPFTKHIISTDVHDLINQVKAADLDGDGDYDIVAAGKNNGTIGFYENDGSQNFTLQKTITNVSGTEFIEVADLDDDGDMDVLASVGNLDKIVWYEDSLLLLTSTIPSARANNVAVDSNIVLNFDNNVHPTSISNNTIVISGTETGIIDGVFSGGGTSQVTFNPTTNFKAGETITVTISDGVQDNLFSAPISKTISYKFITQTNLNLGFELDLNQTEISIDNTRVAPFGFDSADVDGDGDIDLLIGSANDNNLDWYENDGNQNFTKNTVSTELVVPAFPVYADIDKDGHLDIVSTSFGSSSISWFQNDGFQNFGSPVTIGTQVDPYFITVVDVDIDGDMDVICTSYVDVTLAWYENDGSNLFTKHIIPNNTGFAPMVETIDLDNDGDIDILIPDATNNEFSWLENNGSQSFIKHILPVTNVNNTHRIKAIDMDNDGDLDIYTSYSNNVFPDPVSWLENDGNENFTEHLINTYSSKLDSDVADIDGDGDYDIIIRGDNGFIKVIRNDGNQNFNPLKSISFGQENTTLIVNSLTDLDSDGDLDIIYSNPTDSKFVWVENKTVFSWKGITTDWATTSNWSTNTVPTATDNVVVYDNGIIPIASSDISLDKLFLYKDSKLTVNGNLNSNSIELKNNSSLIVGGTVSGNVTYTKEVPVENVWYGIASPVVGQDIDNFVNNHNLVEGNGNNLGLGVYDNSLPGWSYYDSSNGESGFNFMPGEGRIINSTSNNILFSGTMNTNDVLDINLTLGVNGFNLLGNPYPSYINGNAILTTNSALLSEQTFWLWNQETNSYDTYNLASDLKIAPTQGFFVEASSNASNFSITEAMQSHNETDTFQRQANNSFPTITLQLSNGQAQKETVIKYIEGTTTGFDNGYDSSVFDSGNSLLLLYSNLVTDNEGQKLSIQSLPNENYEDMVIPIGFQVQSAGEITISAESFDLPDNLKLYLEDREQNSVTELSDASDYSINVEADSEITNRFFLHTKSRTLSLNDIDELKNVNVYVANDYLYIKGLNNEKGTLQLYNLLGQKFIDENIENIDSNYKIKLPRVSKGVFVVNLEYNGKKITKKILL